MGIMKDLINKQSEDRILREQDSISYYQSQSDSIYEDVDVINLKNINQVYKDKNGKDFTLFENFNFDIKKIKDEDQFVSLLGKSGFGKSTLLRYIVGLQEPTSGEIHILAKTKTEDHRIPMIFQQYSSLPWK